MSITTREAGPEDASLVGELLHDFNVEFESPTPSAGTLAERFRPLLAREDVLVQLGIAKGEVAGFAFLTLRPTPYYEDGSFAQLEELYVLPTLRDGGVGTRLLADVVEIDVDTRRFYERYGFVNVQPGTGHRMLCYLREL